MVTECLIKIRIGQASEVAANKLIQGTFGTLKFEQQHSLNAFCFKNKSSHQKQAPLRFYINKRVKLHAQSPAKKLITWQPHNFVQSGNMDK